MLRQVTLGLSTENDLQDAAKRHGVTLAVSDCKPFNAKGMSLLLELRGNPDAVKDAITEIRKAPGVRQALQGEEGGGASPLLVVIDRPVMCRASNDAAIICLECPINSAEGPAQWKFVARKTGELRQIITKLSQEGVESRITDISPLDQKASLTGRQEEILATAVASGYFEFPRRISLTGLSHLVGVRPSTLSEILRSAEKRIMENAVGGELIKNKRATLTRTLGAPQRTSNPFD